MEPREQVRKQYARRRFVSTRWFGVRRMSQIPRNTHWSDEIEKSLNGQYHQARSAETSAEPKIGRASKRLHSSPATQREPSDQNACDESYYPGGNAEYGVICEDKQPHQR